MLDKSYFLHFNLSNEEEKRCNIRPRNVFDQDNDILADGKSKIFYLDIGY